MDPMKINKVFGPRPVSEPEIHPTAVVEPPHDIGAGTRIWHFTHVMAGAELVEHLALKRRVGDLADRFGWEARSPDSGMQHYTGCVDDVAH